MQSRSYAKLNIFLKIVGTRGDYHELASRFVRYDALFDTISFVPQKCERFTIEGVDIPIEQNIVYKAYLTLLGQTKNRKIAQFFSYHKVHIHKRIPTGAGLGGGSSNAATFIKMVNETLDLALSIPQMAAIGTALGADVPFFIYDYPAANVRGIGEVIEPFEDDVPDIELKLMPIHCDTVAVYRNYRAKFFKPDPDMALQLLPQTSRQILDTIAPLQANDLYQSAADLCPDLAEYRREWFLSGSGSTLFRSRK